MHHAVLPGMNDIDSDVGGANPAFVTGQVLSVSGGLTIAG
jgi:hypothetical protein